MSPKFYFTRDRDGKPVKYHEAPGGDELHIPHGDNVEDYLPLIPETMQSYPARHPFWDSFIGRFMGGDSGSATWRLVQICIFIGGVYQFIGTAKETLNELHGNTRALQAHSIAIDSLRDVSRALGTPVEIEELKSQVNLGTKIANKHFPKDVSDYQQQMQWTMRPNSFSPR